MSEKQEHRRRFNMRYEYVKAMEAWLAILADIKITFPQVIAGGYATKIIVLYSR